MHPQASQWRMYSALPMNKWTSNELVGDSTTEAVYSSNAILNVLYLTCVYVVRCLLDQLSYVKHY